MILQGGERCYYCGLDATERDHVIPWSLFHTKINTKRSYEDDEVVPCCSQCNLIAGNKVFDSFVEKREHIQSEIKRKYKKILNFPNWEKEELDELGKTLKIQIKATIKLKKLIEARINWPDKFYTESDFIKELPAFLFDD